MSPGPHRDVPALLAAVQAADPGRPRLTWYAPARGPGAHERIELSARVLVNWVAKTANLLVEELDAVPGTRVALDLPPHWKQVVWALATWSVGAEVVPADGSPAGADVLVSARADERTGPLLVAVALPSLARRFDPEPPAGWLDWAAEVAGFDDAMPVPAGPLDHADLLATARAAGRADRARVLVDCSDVVAGATAAPQQVLAALAVDGSAVLAGRPLTEGERASERIG